VAQICQENTKHVDETQIQSIYHYISRIAFLPDQVYSHQKSQKSQASSKNVNSLFYKTLRGAFNCIANLLSQDCSPFIQSYNEEIFTHLRAEFEYMMSKIQHYYRSKRFISQMTTVLRALQFSMNLGQGADMGLQAGQQHKKKAAWQRGDPALRKQGSLEMVVSDREAVDLFIGFYKLLFLGTDFARKMLKIKLEKGSGNEVRKIIINDHAQTDEENKSDGNYLNDTSDFGSEVNDAAHGTHRGSVVATASEPDPYQKIKQHAAFALQNLLKNNAKAIQPYWYILFPTFMLGANSEFAAYIKDFRNPATQKQFKEQVWPFLET